MSKILIDEETLYSVIDTLNIGYFISSGKEQQMIFDVRHKLLDDLQGLLDELQETKSRFSVLEWHPMSEKPKDESDILVREKDGCIFDTHAFDSVDDGDWEIVRGDKNQIVEWAYPPK